MTLHLFHPQPFVFLNNKTKGLLVPYPKKNLTVVLAPDFVNLLLKAVRFQKHNEILCFICLYSKAKNCAKVVP